ncbi:MAG: response regulator transcription factor [Acutalibacteraceae bacterium]|nr:response regulator transcription factor [Acutalibacteraceae bacterium]
MIYLLEDDESIVKFVIYALRQTGFEAQGFLKPSEFKGAVESKTPDLCLLDIMLPEEDGISVLKWLRNRTDTADMPIIMLTAKASEYDKVAGLDAGADDYIAKPFGTMELISRIKALLRRTKTADKVYTAGSVTLNPKAHTVTSDGKEVMLTLKEFQMLCLMLKNRGTVFSRDRLLEEIWGYDYDGENRTVDVHIKTLRTKLGESGAIIETVRGVGYKIS